MLLYCQSCEEPICELCTRLGPHNTQTHRIIDIHQAYNQRVASLSHMINSSLIFKRDSLMKKSE